MTQQHRAPRPKGDYIYGRLYNWCKDIHNPKPKAHEAKGMLQKKRGLSAPPYILFFWGVQRCFSGKSADSKKILASNPLYEIVSALTFHKYLIGQRQISKLLLLHIDIILNLNSFLSKTLNVVDQVSHVVGWPPSAWQYGGNKGSEIKDFFHFIFDLIIFSYHLILLS